MIDVSDRNIHVAYRTGSRRRRAGRPLEIPVAGKGAGGSRKGVPGMKHVNEPEGRPCLEQCG